MSSAAKTLELLAYFSQSRPEIGLSQMCRLAGRDKATTFRHLQALESVGFVEQNPTTKTYRLGPALLRLAQTREATVPRKAGAEQVLKDLAKATGETTHVSVLSGSTLYSLASCESDRHSARVIIDEATFPLHATASGICVLAFGPEGLLDVALDDVQPFTSATITSKEALAHSVQRTRDEGISASFGGYEDGVFSFSAPIFDQSRHCAGAVSVACVAARHSQDHERQIRQQLIPAAQRITRNWGGVIPAHVTAAWTQATSHLKALETAS